MTSQSTFNPAFQGRVTMSMTTLLTLSTMFNSLTTVTPPISYTTKLDKWMVFCIIFVFATLLEFTVVIFLKYYLRHLPVFQVDNVFSNPDSATITKKMDQKKIFDVRRQLANWIQKEATEKQDFVKVLKIKAKKDQRPVQADLDDSSDDDDSGSEDERKAIISRYENTVFKNGCKKSHFLSASEAHSASTYLFFSRSHLSSNRINRFK